LTFSYFGLECKVSTSLLADTVSLAGFESTITDLIVEAMIKAIDLGVVSGTGSASLLGITVDSRVPAAQVVTLSPAEFASWDGWKKKVFAKMPMGYKAGATFLMASGTFEVYVDGMVDANGQPVGRINYGITDGPQERFGGKEVIQVEDDVIAPYDDAATGAVVAVYCNLKNYGFNSNMQMTMFRYLDHDTNEWIDKAILIADGKLIDPNGVVIIKKGA
jgi:HK97 family phage major capsid protein